MSDASLAWAFKTAHLYKLGIVCHIKFSDKCLHIVIGI